MPMLREGFKKRPFLKNEPSTSHRSENWPSLKSTLMSHKPSIMFQIESWANDFEVLLWRHVWTAPYSVPLSLVFQIFKYSDQILSNISDLVSLVWFVWVPPPSGYWNMAWPPYLQVPIILTSHHSLHNHHHPHHQHHHLHHSFPQWRPPPPPNGLHEHWIPTSWFQPWPT